MYPVDKYFIFYYSHSDKPIDFVLVYRTDTDKDEDVNKIYKKLEHD